MVSYMASSVVFLAVCGSTALSLSHFSLSVSYDCSVMTRLFSILNSLFYKFWCFDRASKIFDVTPCCS